MQKNMEGKNKIMCALIATALAAAAMAGGFTAVDTFYAHQSTTTTAMSSVDTNGTNHVSTSHWRRRSHEAPHHH